MRRRTGEVADITMAQRYTRRQGVLSLCSVLLALGHVAAQYSRGSQLFNLSYGQVTKRLASTLSESLGVPAPVIEGGFDTFAMPDDVDGPPGDYVYEPPYDLRRVSPGAVEAGRARAYMYWHTIIMDACRGQPANCCDGMYSSPQSCEIDAATGVRVCTRDSIRAGAGAEAVPSEEDRAPDFAVSTDDEGCTDLGVVWPRGTGGADGVGEARENARVCVDARVSARVSMSDDECGAMVRRNERADLCPRTCESRNASIRVGVCRHTHTRTLMHTCVEVHILATSYLIECKFRRPAPDELPHLHPYTRPGPGIALADEDVYDPADPLDDVLAHIHGPVHPRCGTYLEVHRVPRGDAGGDGAGARVRSPLHTAVLARTRVRGLTAGLFRTVLSLTHTYNDTRSLCWSPTTRGEYELWLVQRTLKHRIIRAIQPFRIVDPLCDWDDAAGRYKDYATIDPTTGEPLARIDTVLAHKRVPDNLAFTRPRPEGRAPRTAYGVRPGKGMGVTYVSPSHTSFPPGARFINEVDTDYLLVPSSAAFSVRKGVMEPPVLAPEDI